MFLSRKASEETPAYLSRLTQHFFSVLDASDADKARERRNWRMYSGIDYGQWDEEALQLLRSEGRPAHQFNIIQGAVDWIAGILAQNKVETVFEPVNMLKPGKVNLAQHMFEYERERGHWDHEEFKFARAGLIYRGVAKYGIDYTTSQLGNLSWTDIAPWNVTPDPAWATDNVKSLRFNYQDDFYDADYISDHWRHKAQDLKLAVDQMKDQQEQFDTQRRLGDNWGRCMQNGKYRVLELHFMEDEDEAELWDFVKGQSAKSLPMPAQEVMAKEDPKRFKKIIRTNRVEKVVVWCPAFGSSGILLSEGKSALQMGRISYDFYSAKNLYGQVQGTVDPMIDAQEVFNKRESSVSYWEAQTTNGSTIADKTFFPDENSQRKLETEGNKPGLTHWADGGGRDLRTAVIAMPVGAAPVHVMQGAERMQNLVEHIAHIDIAMRPGAGADKGSSGQHMEELLAASHVPFEPLNQALQCTWADRAEAFIPCATYIYQGPPRRIKAASQQKAVVINYPTDLGVENGIEELQRYDFTIKMSALGADKKMRDSRALSMQLQTVQNPLMRTQMEKQMNQYYPFTEQDRANLDKAADTFYAFQEFQMTSQMEAAQQAKAQAMQNQQAQAQQMQNPEQGGQGGKPMPPPQDANDAAGGPGMGPIPDSSGIAGSQSAANNVQRTSPSDM